MKRVEQTYKNGKQVMKVDLYACECGGSMREVGYAGCAHDDNFTYFYQCETCKRVDSSSLKLPRTSLGDLELYGWKKQPLDTNK